MGGKLSILDYELPGKERLIKEKSCYEGNNKISIIRYNSKSLELITGEGNGKVVIWCIKIRQQVHAWEDHKSEIKEIQYREDNWILITCGKDKAIRIWKLPEKWMEEEVENYVKAEIKNQKASLAMYDSEKDGPKFLRI